MNCPVIATQSDLQGFHALSNGIVYKTKISPYKANTGK